MARFGKKHDDAPVEAGEVTTDTVHETPVVEATEAPAKKGSIVPNKYAGKYKNGGSDALAEFINGQCNGKDGFEFTAFFALCRKNGIAEAHVAPYEEALAAKQHGSQGRARMTLRNRLASLVRKNSKLVGLNGDEHELSLPPLPSRAKPEQAEAAAA